MSLGGLRHLLEHLGVILEGLGGVLGGLGVILGRHASPAAVSGATRSNRVQQGATDGIVVAPATSY